jgi:hypothetical protein
MEQFYEHFALIVERIATFGTFWRQQVWDNNLRQTCAIFRLWNI